MTTRTCILALLALRLQAPFSPRHASRALALVPPLSGALDPMLCPNTVFRSEVESALPELLTALCTESPVVALEKKQALAKQMAEILSFVLKFDDLKMNKPEIQNDFSYYRRTLSRLKMQDPGSDDSAVVNNEEANRMSLFYAYPTPMLRSVSEATTKFVTENKEIPLENTTDCLAIMCTLCRVMVSSANYYDRFVEKEATIQFCQRVMIACVILYDHVHHLGAFKKGAAIDVRIQTILYPNHLPPASLPPAPPLQRGCLVPLPRPSLVCLAGVP